MEKGVRRETNKHKRFVGETWQTWQLRADREMLLFIRVFCKKKYADAIKVRVFFKAKFGTRMKIGDHTSNFVRECVR